jgi:hypothetical protein
MRSAPKKTVLRKIPASLVSMRMRDLSAGMFLAVPCPTCGVAAGMRCLLHSGGRRNEPHIDRKLIAIEAVETKRILRANRNKSLHYVPVSRSR